MTHQKSNFSRPFTAVVFFDEGDGCPATRSQTYGTIFDAQHWAESVMRADKTAKEWIVVQGDSYEAVASSQGHPHEWKWVPIYQPGRDDRDTDPKGVMVGDALIELQRRWQRWSFLKADFKRKRYTLSLKHRRVNVASHAFLQTPEAFDEMLAEIDMEIAHFEEPKNRHVFGDTR